jgi:hypothetical protein
MELMKEFKRGALLRRGGGEAIVWRVFTSYDRTDCRNCQYLYVVLLFRDWAQTQCRFKGSPQARTARGNGILDCDHGLHLSG